MKTRSKNAGQTVLLIVVFIVTLLIVFSVRGQKIVEIEQTVVERSRLKRAAENAFQNITQKAIWLLENDARLEEEATESDPNATPFDSFFDKWSKTGPETPHHEGNIIVRWNIVDAHAYFNINSLLTGEIVNETSREKFQLFLEHLQIKDADKLTASLADWIDAAPSEEAKQLSPFDSNFYEQNAKNGPLLTLSELQMVPGFTKDILWGDGEDIKYGLYSCLTVAPISRLNANSVPAHVMLLLDPSITPTIASRVEGGRNSSAYESIAEVTTASGLPAESPINNLFTVHSDYFFLELEADYQGEYREKKRILLLRQGKAVTVQYIESPGLFEWDEKLREKMDESVKILIESISE